MTSRCCVYDFTLFYPKYWEYDETDEAYHTGILFIRNTLMAECKKYCFQLEKGEKTGRYHLQGRFSLKEKLTMNATLLMLNEVGWRDYHLSVTSNENRKNMFYVMKQKTRVDGPYKDDDIKIPREVLKMKVLRPWQDKFKRLMETYDERGIHCLIDPRGNIGKSMFVKYMCVLHKAGMMPFCESFRDVMRIAYDIGERSVYMIDLPRSTTAKETFQMMKAIEILKNGYCFDDRNRFRERHSDNVNVAVFSNFEPNLSQLTVDRWHLWAVDDNMRLVKYKNRLDYVDVDCSDDENPNSSSSSRNSDSCSEESSIDEKQVLKKLNRLK